MSATMVEQGEPPTLETGTVVAGRYKVLGLIGKGGMGVVYRAEHVHMRKTVALKVLHREFLKVDEVVARFEREAVAAARIEHPNVVAASDFGKLEDGSFYLVLEFVDGQSLRSLIEKGGALPIARTIRIAQQTLLALGAAHGSHIVHRDLKPDNVMLVADPEGGDRVKVLDFGIARVAGPDQSRNATKLTQMGMVMGTVAYMSPEQATGQAVDERADLYSFGVMLYEMIAGVVPFDAELPSQVLARQLVEEPPPLPAGTPEPLVRLVMDLMQKKPEDRPASAQEVQDRLSELTATPSGRVVAPPSGPPRIVLYAAGGAVVLFAALGLALSGRSDERSAASAEPVVSNAPAAPTGSAPSGSDGEPMKESPAAAPSVTPPAAAVPPPSAEARPAEAATKAARPAAKSTAKATKSKPPPAPAPASNPPKRKTGPGGIYIPPPDQWFK
jgi:serine/threonine protein kinase